MVASTRLERDLLITRCHRQLGLPQRAIARALDLDPAHVCRIIHAVGDGWREPERFAGDEPSQREEIAFGSLGVLVAASRPGGKSAPRR